ncbi:ABC transporter substrate-binding protein [Paenibacillus glycanilyticus]|uniref:ABC transporter substrate-binding protein n=1 Tax=Paenibacillus glycanilyticus TaxID=126569 RepID=UPI003EBD5C32
MKKLSFALLSVTVCMSLALAACGNNEANKTEEGNKPTDTSSPATATNSGGDEQASQLKPYKLTMFYPGTPQPDEAKVEEKMNEILTKKINATIDIQTIDWGAWNDKMNLMFATGEPADVIFTASWNGHAQNAKKGAFLELDELLNKYGKEILATENPKFLEGARIDGKLYAIPTNKEIGTSRGVVVRKDIAEKYNMNFSNVKTIADLEPFLKTVKEKEPGMTPLFESQTATIPTFASVRDALGDATIPGVISATGTDTKVYNYYETPEALDTFKVMRSFFTQGYINKDAATSKQSASDVAKAGKIFMWPEALKPGKDKELEATVGYPLQQIELTPAYITTGETTNSMLGISKTSKDPERAMMLINLLHSDKELLNLLDFGIEGVHYEKVSDNVIKLPAGTDPSKRTYNPGSAWMFGDQFLNYLWDNEDPTKWDKFKEFNNSAIASPGLGFVFDFEPVKSEVAVQNNIGPEFLAALEVGAVDPEEVLPKFIEKMKAGGLDKIIAEKQKQLDAFLAAKK